MTGISSKYFADQYFGNMDENFMQLDSSMLDSYSSGGGSGLGQFLLGGLKTGLGAVAGGLPGALLNFGTGIMQSAIQNRQQRKFYEDYMSPSARMKDMVSAGINPAAAAQGISGAAAAPAMNAAPAGEGVGKSIEQSGSNMAVQENLVNAQVDNLRQNTNLQASQTTGQDITNEFTRPKAEATINKLLAEGNLTTKQAALLQKDLDHWDELFTLNTNKIRSEIDVFKKQLKLMDSEIDLNGAHKSEAQKRADKMEYLNQFLFQYGYELNSVEGRIFQLFLDGDDVGAWELIDAIGAVTQETAYSQSAGSSYLTSPNLVTMSNLNRILENPHKKQLLLEGFDAQIAEVSALLNEAWRSNVEVQSAEWYALEKELDKLYRSREALLNGSYREGGELWQGLVSEVKSLISAIPMLAALFLPYKAGARTAQIGFKTAATRGASKSAGFNFK